MPRPLLLLFVLPLLLAGCVSSGKHKALQEEYATTRLTLEQELAGCRDRAASLEESLAEAELELSAARAREQALERDVHDLEGRVASLLKDRSQYQQSVDELQSALVEAAARRRQAEARVAEFRQLLERFSGMIDAGTLSVRIVDGRMVLQLPADVLFPSGVATLSTAGRDAVREVAGGLASMPGRRWQVEGHTDSVPVRRNPRFADNWELGAGRALSVVREMVDAGLPPDQVSGASFGPTRPVASNDDEEGRQRNRRIEIALLPDLSQLPGYEELQEAVGAKAGP